MAFNTSTLTTAMRLGGTAANFFPGAGTAIGMGLNAGASIIDQVQQEQERKKQEKMMRDVIQGNYDMAALKVFPTQGVESPIFSKGGIIIKKANRGKFTDWAKAHGMTVAQAAHKIMANKEKYSNKLVKRANFAKNFAKRKPFGGEVDGELPQDNSLQLASNIQQAVGNPQGHYSPGGDIPVFDQQGNEQALVENGEVLLDGNKVLSSRTGYAQISSMIGEAKGILEKMLDDTNFNRLDEFERGTFDRVSEPLINVGKTLDNAIQALYIQQEADKAKEQATIAAAQGQTMAQSQTQVPPVGNSTNPMMKCGGKVKRLFGGGIAKKDVPPFDGMYGYGYEYTTGFPQFSKLQPNNLYPLGYGARNAASGTGQFATDTYLPEVTVNGSTIKKTTNNIDNSSTGENTIDNTVLTSDILPEYDRTQDLINTNIKSKYNGNLSQFGNTQNNTDAIANNLKSLQSTNNVSSGTTGTTKSGLFNQLSSGLNAGLNGGQSSGIGFGLENAIPFADNIANAIITANMPKIPTPIMQKAVPMKTDVNITPQLNELTNQQAALNKYVNENTSNSAVARTNKLAGMAEGVNARNELYGAKQNAETELINQNLANAQTINTANIDEANTYNTNKMMRKVAQQDAYSTNAANAVEDYNKLLEDARSQGLSDKEAFLIAAQYSDTGSLQSLYESGMFDNSPYKDLIYNQLIKAGRTVSQ